MMTPATMAPIIAGIIVCKGMDKNMNPTEAKKIRITFRPAIILLIFVKNRLIIIHPQHARYKPHSTTHNT